MSWRSVENSVTVIMILAQEEPMENSAVEMASAIAEHASKFWKLDHNNNMKRSIIMIDACIEIKIISY